MPNPPIVIRDSDWPAHARERTEAKYEDFVPPGAYWDPNRGRTYCPESTFIAAILDRKRWARMLLKHEEFDHGLDVPLNKHPTKLLDEDGKDKQGKPIGRIPMLTHAFKVRFDDRAATRFLRFRWYKPNLEQFKRWEEDLKHDWNASILPVRSAADLKKEGL